MANKKVNFGFKEVDETQKAPLVKGVFNSVASKYDIMNDFMSFGLHRLWKKEFQKEIPPRKGHKLLDIAAGSGDISFLYLEKAKQNSIDTSCVVTDVNQEMLNLAKEKSFDENIKNVEFKIVDCENIDFPENSFDYVTISFGIRNVTNIDKGLKEIYRVLKPGGKFVCLEFSNVENENIKKLYDFYSFNVIPKVGGIVAKDEDSYSYLVESIRLFPHADDFNSMIADAGFVNNNYKKMNFGVVSIHYGFKD